MSSPDKFGTSSTVSGLPTSNETEILELYSLAESAREDGDQDKAIRLFQECLDKSGNTHIDSLMQLGGIYADRKEFSAALPYYVRASELGVAHAYTCLALIYEDTDNVVESVSLQRKAVEMKDTEAFYLLGFKYLYGTDVDMNVTKAKELFQEGTDLGDMHCVYHLGLMCLDEGEVNTALPQIEKAYLGGIPEAVYTLAEYTKDETRAYELYKESADKYKDENAMLKVCLALKIGKGCTKDPIGMLKYLNMAAECGNEDALDLVQHIRDQVDNNEDANLSMEESIDHDNILQVKLQRTVSVMSIRSHHSLHRSPSHSKNRKEDSITRFDHTHSLNSQTSQSYNANPNGIASALYDHVDVSDVLLNETLTDDEQSPNENFGDIVNGDQMPIVTAPIVVIGGPTNHPNSSKNLIGTSQTSTALSRHNSSTYEKRRKSIHELPTQQFEIELEKFELELQETEKELQIERQCLVDEKEKLRSIIQDTTLGDVARKVAQQELASLELKDPLPLEVAILNHEAAVRQLQRLRDSRYGGEIRRSSLAHSDMMSGYYHNDDVDVDQTDNVSLQSVINSIGSKEEMTMPASLRIAMENLEKQQTDLYSAEAMPLQAPKLDYSPQFAPQQALLNDDESFRVTTLSVLIPDNSSVAGSSVMERGLTPSPSVNRDTNLYQESVISSTVSVPDAKVDTENVSTGEIDPTSNTTVVVKEEEPPADPTPPEAETQPPVRRIGYIELYKFTTPGERVILIPSLLFCCICGVQLPFFAIIFGDIVNGQGATSINQVMSDAVKALCYLAAATGGAGFLGTGGMGIVGERLGARMRQKYVEALMRQEIAWHEGVDASDPDAVKSPDSDAMISQLRGDVNTRITSDLLIYQQAVGEKAALCIIGFSGLIAGLFIAFYQGWELSLVVLSAIPVMVISVLIMGLRTSGLAAYEQYMIGQTSSLLNNYLSNIRQVHTSTYTRQVLKNLGAMIHTTYELSQTKDISQGIGAGIFLFLLECTYALGLWYGSELIIDRKSTWPGSKYTGGAVLSIFNSLIISILCLGNAAPNLIFINTARALVYPVYYVIHRTSLIDYTNEEGVMVTKQTVTGRVYFNDVKFAYPGNPNRLILDGFSMDFQGGQTTGLQGGSGCGKSTVVQLLERTADVNGGQIYVEVKLDPLNWRSKQVYFGEHAKSKSHMQADNHKNTHLINWEWLCERYFERYEASVGRLPDNISKQALYHAVHFPGATSAQYVPAHIRPYDLPPVKEFHTWVDIQDQNLLSWRQCLTLITQQGKLFPGTILDNIMTEACACAHLLPTQADIDVSVDENVCPCVVTAARLACVSAFIDNLPDTYYTDVSVAGGLLSGGQRQRLVIARALHRGGSMLLCDEHTSALDYATEVEIHENFQQMLEAARSNNIKMTCIIIAHRPSALRSCNSVITMDKGKIMKAVPSHQTHQMNFSTPPGLKQHLPISALSNVAGVSIFDIDSVSDISSMLTNTPINGRSNGGHALVADTLPLQNSLSQDIMKTYTTQPSPIPTTPLHKQPSISAWPTSTTNRGRQVFFKEQGLDNGLPPPIPLSSSIASPQTPIPPLYPGVLTSNASVSEAMVRSFSNAHTSHFPVVPTTPMSPGTNYNKVHFASATVEPRTLSRVNSISQAPVLQLMPSLTKTPTLVVNPAPTSIVPSFQDAEVTPVPPTSKASKKEIFWKSYMTKEAFGRSVNPKLQQNPAYITNSLGSTVLLGSTNLGALTLKELDELLLATPQDLRLLPLIDHTAEPYEPTLSKVIFSNVPALLFMVLFALVEGCVFPAFSLIMAEMSAIYYHPSPSHMSERAGHYAGLLVALGAAAFVAVIIKMAAVSNIAKGSIRFLKNIAVESLLRRPIGWHEQPGHTPGKLVSDVTLYPSIVKTFIIDKLTSVVVIIGNIAFTAVVCFAFSSNSGSEKVAIVSICAVLPVLGMCVLIQSFISASAIKATAKQVESIATLASDAASNIRAVAVYNYEVRIVEAIRETSLLAASHGALAAFGRALGYGLSQAGVLLCYALMFWYGGKQITDGKMSMTDMIRIFTAIQTCSNQVGQLVGVGMELSRCRDYLAIGTSLTDTQVAENPYITSERTLPLHVFDGSVTLPTTDGANYEPFPLDPLYDPRVSRNETNRHQLAPLNIDLYLALPPTLVFHNVWFAYPTRPVYVLRGLSLSVNAEAKTCITGESGCGKSSLFSLLLRIYDNDNTQTLLSKVEHEFDEIHNEEQKKPRLESGHKDLTETHHESNVELVELKTSRKRFSIKDFSTIPASTNPGIITYGGIDITCIPIHILRALIGIAWQDTPLFPCSVFDNIACGREQTMSDVIEACKCAHIHHVLAQLPEGYDTDMSNVSLSGGERARLGIARCIVNRPKVVLFDEVTAALDAESARIVLKNLETRLEHTTVITIAHNLSIVEDCDAIFVLKDGIVAESGTHTELIDVGGIYSDLVSSGQEMGM